MKAEQFRNQKTMDRIEKKFKNEWRIIWKHS